MLEHLAITRDVAEALGLPTAAVIARYESIKNALIQSVHAVHAQWDAVPNAVLDTLAAAMRHFDSVYTTSYDLLTYWAYMRDQDSFFDYFWGMPGNFFDPTSVALLPDRTRLLFLHGGLHLVRRDGIERKRTHNGQTLLAQFGSDDGEAPLFVSEGTSTQKLKAIRNSPYLSFAYNELRADTHAIVVFGLRLRAEDAHIAAAINRFGITVGIGLRMNKPVHEIAARMAQYDQVLNRTVRYFFDAATHPLGGF